jgi:Domain of unknown function (DUF4419)
MKEIIFIAFLALLLAHCSFAQNNVKPVHSTHFKVCDVNTAKKPLETVPYSSITLDSVSIARINQNAWKAYIQGISGLDESKKFDLYELIYQNDLPQTIKIDAASQGTGMLVQSFQANAIAEAIVRAYADHRPLVLSPDMIWLLIMQGFSAHIDTNSERMRPYFVDFKGKQLIEIKRGSDWIKGNPNNDWPGIFEEFGQKIAQKTKNGIASTCTPQFTTTGIAEKAAFEVSLMQSMKHYFDYKFTVSCGIPEITLEGTPEDWALLEKHAAELAQFDLAWWIDPLKPILAEFTKASKGEVNADFWDNMVKYRSYSIICSSQPFLSGWMLHFFPYYQGKPNPWVANPAQVKKFEKAFTGTEKEKNSFERKIVEPEQFGLPTLTVSDLPSSMSAAPIEFNYHETPYNYELLAGAIGIRQDDRTFALRPEFGWRVLDKGLKAVKTEEIFAEYLKKNSKK